MYNFNLTCVDTDSISFYKDSGEPFTKDEYSKILKDINAVLPDKVKLAFEDQFSKMVVLRAKNYIYLSSTGKVTYKGSSLKSATLEPAIKDFLKEIIDSLLNDKQNFLDIYNKYVRLINSVTDIKPWCSKRTISDKTINNDRENEAKVMRALEGSDYREGDKVYVFFVEGGELCLLEKFNGNYDKKVLLKKLYKATDRFSEVIDPSIFLDFSLKKKNQKELQEVLSVGQPSTKELLG